MALIDYTSTPIPANGQPRTAASEAAVFTNIANNVNSYSSAVNTQLTALNAFMAAAGSANTPLYLAKRDSNGDIFFRDVYGRSVIASGALYSGPSTRQITNATNGLLLSAALDIIPSYLIDQLAPSSITSLTLSYSGGFTTDGSGNPHQVAAGAILMVPPNPTTQANWALVVANKSTGVVSVSYVIASNSITPSTTQASTDYIIADVYIPANGTGLIVPKTMWAGGTQPFFLDSRYRNQGPPATGGGGGGAAVLFGAVIAGLGASDASMFGTTGVTTPFNFYEWANGSQPAVTRNGVALANIRLKESMIAVDSTQGTLEDANSVSVTGNLDGAIRPQSASIIIQVPGGQPPLTFKQGGKRLTLTDVIPGTSTPIIITSNTISVADVTYVLYANLQSGSLAATLASTPPVGNYIPLRAYFWDGSTFYLEQDFVKPVINSLNVRKNFKSMIYPTTAISVPANTGSVVDMLTGTPGMLTFQLPSGNWRAQARGSVEFQTVGGVGTAADVRFYVKQSTGKATALTGGATDFAQKAPPVASAIETWKFGGLFENLSGGYQNFGLGYYISIGGSPGAFNFFIPYLEVEISRM